MSHAQVFISLVSFSPKLETTHSLFSFRQSSRVSPESRANPRTSLAVLSFAKYVYEWALVQLSNDCRERLRLLRLVIGLKISRTLYARIFPRFERELLGILIGSSRSLFLLRLVEVITLALAFRPSFENRAIEATNDHTSVRWMKAYLKFNLGAFGFPFTFSPCNPAGPFWPFLPSFPWK